MKHLKVVYTFYFKQADYKLGDRNGNEIIMSLDYANNKFKIKTSKQNDEGLNALNKEAITIAKDLLKRKSNVNRARVT